MNLVGNLGTLTIFCKYYALMLQISADCLTIASMVSHQWWTLATMSRRIEVGRWMISGEWWQIALVQWGLAQLQLLKHHVNESPTQQHDAIKGGWLILTILSWLDPTSTTNISSPSKMVCMLHCLLKLCGLHPSTLLFMWILDTTAHTLRRLARCPYTMFPSTMHNHACAFVLNRHQLESIEDCHPSTFTHLQLSNCQSTWS